MNILVTGGAGFIGSHLVEALLEKGHRVTIIDDLSTGSRENIKDIITKDVVTFIEGSILSKDILSGLDQKFDIIFHLAAAVGVAYIIDNPLGSIHTNVLGTENVFEYANMTKTKVVLASTSEVYGKNDNDSLSENDDRIVGSTHITRWSYAASKALDEFVAFAYYRRHGLPIVIARLFNTCGPRQSAAYGMVIPRFIRQALRGEAITVYGTGEQVRTFTYVSDTVRALCALAENELCVGEVFNIGGREPISIKKLAELIKEKTKSVSAINIIPYEKAFGSGFEDMQRRVPNIEKIKSFINFEPKVGLHEILEETIASIKI